MSKSIKYSKFRVVVKNLINDLYNRTEISKSEMMDFESRFIEYAVDCNYDIYVRVACYDLSDYFELTSEDLLRFVEKPRARIKIERLRLYTMVNDAFSKRYYEIGEPDENGIFHDYPEVLKTSCVSTKRFLIKEEDLSLLKEAVDDGNLDLTVKLCEKEVVLEKEQSKNKVETTKAKNPTKLRLVKCKGEVYWGDSLLPTIKDINFFILLELAKAPGKTVKNDKLYKLIDSECNKGVLLNQRITAIRKTFPSPYNDIKSLQCIIPDGKRSKGYRNLNLTKEQVEIV